MVAQAQRSRAPIQRMADQVSGVFVPAVILIALLAFATWALIGPDRRVSGHLASDAPDPVRPRRRHALAGSVAVDPWRKG